MADFQQTLKENPQQRFNKVLGFLKGAETTYPNLVNELPGLLSKMLGDKAFNPNLMIQNEASISFGLAALGSWLEKNGFAGFEVKGLGIFDSGKKLAADLYLNNLASRDTFFANSGINQNHWQELQNAMVDLSKSIGGMLEVGYTSKQVVAALFIESTTPAGSESQLNSQPTREMLTKASGGKLNEVNQVLGRWVNNN